MNIEILPPEGKTKYLGQLSTFQNAVKVELSHRQKLMSPESPLRDRLKLFDGTLTPSLLRFRHADGDKRDEEETQTTQ